MYFLLGLVSCAFTQLSDGLFDAVVCIFIPVISLNTLPNTDMKSYLLALGVLRL